jgi:hypothetical protein
LSNVIKSLSVEFMDIINNIDEGCSASRIEELDNAIKGMESELNEETKTRISLQQEIYSIRNENEKLKEQIDKLAKESSHYTISAIKAFETRAEKAEAEAKRLTELRKIYNKDTTEREKRHIDLEACLERAKALPDVWRLFGPQDMGLDETTLRHCADELESAVKGESSVLDGKSWMSEDYDMITYSKYFGAGVIITFASEEVRDKFIKRLSGGAKLSISSSASPEGEEAG